MDLGLSGKRAVVTGSTAGIGYAIAAALAREGALAVVNGRKPEHVAEAIARLSREVPGARIEGVTADLATEEGANKLLTRVPETDILVNNLGYYEAKEFQEISDDDWRRMFEVNVFAGVRLCRHYLPRMKAAGWGRVIFISSESGIQIPEEMIHYGVSKTALLGVSRGLSLLTKGTGVTVNVVLPGPTASEGVKGFVDDIARKKGVSREEAEAEFFATMRPTSLIQRFADPAEVAAMVAFVASPAASAVNGAALRVDGGVVNAVF